MASNGKQALQLTNRKEYDLLLIDHRMPIMDGMEMIRALRASKDNPNAKKVCIALTANAISGAREEYIAAGFDDYLVKPVNGDRLEQTLLKYLPKEKIKMTDPSFHEEDSLPDILKRVEENGYLDIGEGISYAGGVDLYIEALKFFVKTIVDKSLEIRKFYDKEQWNDYKIKVHALKSSAKLVGAMELSNKARALEMACTSGDMHYLQEHTGEVLAFYCSYLKKIPLEEL